MTTERITKREINFPGPGFTDHVEETVTEKCYLIAQETPCSGCTMVNLQEPDGGVTGEGQGLRMNVDFITARAEKEVKKGINLITYMGGEPLSIRGFDEVIAWTTMHPTLTSLNYGSCSYFFDKAGNLNSRYHSLAEAGLFDENYFLASVDRPIHNESDIGPSDITSFKAYWGLRLIEELLKRGHNSETLAIHQVMRADTIDYTLELYQWARDHNIPFSLCPMVYKPYTTRRDSPAPIEFYSQRLTQDHKPQVTEIVTQLIQEENDRLMRGLPRSLIPSSVFIGLIPKYGIDNSLNCREHREGKRPNTYDIYPNGNERWCIAQNSLEDGLACGGCFYIGINRGHSDYWHLRNLSGAIRPNDVDWLNYHVARKSPHFDASRRNLIFPIQTHG